jgi:hypothetical protein
MIKGSCLCGQVRYVAEETSGPMAHCHCRVCRKAHGAAFSTILPVQAQGFRWIAGETLLACFESSPGKQRWFCSECGSQLISTRDTVVDTLLLRAGCIDTGYTHSAVAHGWVESMPAWSVISDDLPQFKRGLPGAPPGSEPAPTDRETIEPV